MVVEFAYLMLLFVTLLLSTTMKVHLAEGRFQFISAAMGVLITFIFVAAFVTTGLDSDEFKYFRWVFIGAWLVSYLVPIMYNVRESCKHLLKYIFGLAVMVLMAPTVFVMISIYSISNIHDCTWGRGALSAEKAAKTMQTIVENYEKFRSTILTVYIFLNYGFILTMRQLSASAERYYVLLVLCYLGGLLWLKIIFSILYRIRSLFT